MKTSLLLASVRSLREGIPVENTREVSRMGTNIWESSTEKADHDFP